MTMEQYLLDFFTWVSAKLLVVVCKNPGKERKHTFNKSWKLHFAQNIYLSFSGCSIQRLHSSDDDYMAAHNIKVMTVYWQILIQHYPDKWHAPWSNSKVNTTDIIKCSSVHACGWHCSQYKKEEKKKREKNERRFHFQIRPGWHIVYGQLHTSKKGRKSLTINYDKHQLQGHVLHAVSVTTEENISGSFQHQMYFRISPDHLYHCD